MQAPPTIATEDLRFADYTSIPCVLTDKDGDPILLQVDSEEIKQHSQDFWKLLTKYSEDVACNSEKDLVKQLKERSFEGSSFNGGTHCNSFGNLSRYEKMLLLASHLRQNVRFSFHSPIRIPPADTDSGCKGSLYQAYCWWQVRSPRPLSIRRRRRYRQGPCRPLYP